MFSIEWLIERSLTLFKNNSRDSSKFKDCSPLQLSCDLIGMKQTIGYYSYTEPLGAIGQFI